MFTSANWDTSQQVTVTGVDDTDVFDDFLNVYLTSTDIGGEQVAGHVDDDVP